jgi:hypothetical protein
MATVNKFYRGEDLTFRIEITTSEIDIDSATKCALLVYPHNLDFSDTSSSNIAKVKTPTPVLGEGYVQFTIPFYISRDMEANDYTVDFIVGDGVSNVGTASEGSRSIYRWDSVFTLIDNGVNVRTNYEIDTPTLD